MMITVFTPTYNRAHYLEAVYISLCKQTYTDFEWVIVDDGSKDETRNFVEKIVQRGENSFPIRYFYQENGGKHRAINHGVKVALGELFLILDSDDCLTEGALEIVSDYWNQVKNNASFCGVCGRIAHRDGTLIGLPFDQEIMDMSYVDCRYRFGIVGDMIEVIRTDVMRRYPFPEFPNETFCPEAIIWNRIGNDYKMRYFNRIIYFRDYLEGGLTDKIVRLRMNNPLASMTCYSELTRYHIPFIQKVKAAINYWRFAICVGKQKHQIKVSYFWYWTLPLGALMYYIDSRKMK